jgi:hypothetical protein
MKHDDNEPTEPTENPAPNAVQETPAPDMAAEAAERNAERKAEHRANRLENLQATLAHNLVTPDPPTVERFEELRNRLARAADDDDAATLAYAIARLEVSPFLGERDAAEAILRLADTSEAERRARGGGGRA